MYGQWGIEALSQPARMKPSEEQTPIQKLETRLIALETKLRHSNPEHPCDCKYELSLLEERLGSLNEHPWEHKLSKVKERQKTDRRLITDIRDDLQEYKRRLDVLIGDYGMEAGRRILEPGNLVNVVWGLSQNAKRLEKWKMESERAFERLDQLQDQKLLDEKISRGVQVYFTEDLQNIKSEVEVLSMKVDELDELKEKLTNGFNPLTVSIEGKINDLETTIAYAATDGLAASNVAESPFPYLRHYLERCVWVPGTSVSPVHQTSYAHNLPLFLEQPAGWGDARAEICRELEESQKAYYSKAQDAGGDVLGDGLKIESQLDLDLPRPRDTANSPKKKRKKKSKSKQLRSESSTGQYSPPISEIQPVPEEAKPSLSRIETSYANLRKDTTNISHDLVDTHLAERPSTPTPIQGTPNGDDLAAIFPEEAVLSLSPKKSKPSLRKSKSKTIARRRDKPRYTPIDEIFKHSKPSAARDKG
ncbi:hypothetical protein ABW19_dt0204800 [Dactylella cylindrospora]|nr:hypothetical protein ABW19_dt0204800 [Dactylella cylindrospora]